MPDAERGLQRRRFVCCARPSLDPTARLFFALWPDAAGRGALDQAGSALLKDCGGKQMRADNIHLTLVFLGHVAVARIGALRAIADGIEGTSFSVTLNQLGWWRHNRVAWAAPDIAPDPLLALVNQLQDGLRSGGFDFDERPVYVPHVTLLRKARCEGIELPPLAPVEWKAEAFVLVRSVAREAAYEIIGRWGLSQENNVL